MIKKGVKKIGIDARFYGPIGKGLGRYTQEVVDNIIKQDTHNYYVIFLNENNFDEFVTDNPRVKKVMVNAKWYGIEEQIIMPFFIAKERVELMHFPHFNVPLLCPCPFVVTIHDLILFRYPTLRATTLHPLLYKFKNWAYKKVINFAAKKSKKIITVSEFTKKDILKQFAVSEDKVVVTYEGAANLSRGRDNSFVSKLEDADLGDYQIDGEFFLYVGNAYPHKNLDKLLDVFVKFHRQHSNIKLVLIGKEDYFYKQVKALAASLGLWEDDQAAKSAIIFPGYVPDRKLEVFYRKALGYIFPSLYEGFGLPPLEAMAKGCPVASSNRSSMPEILGEAALYFNPENEIEILQAMECLSADASLRAHLVNDGFERIKLFSWQDCAKKTLAVYLGVL